MNDGQYTNIRNYLEEIASQNKQILAELKRSNELLGAQATPKEAASKGTEKPPVTVETVKAAPLKTTETVEVVDAPKTAIKPDAPHATGGKKPGKGK